jgi:hypothetical protein
MGLPDDNNPSSFGDHYMALDIMLDWMDEQAVGKISRFLSNFSAKNLLVNSHQAHQIAAHPFHHLPMGLPDDNPSSFVDHYMALGVMLDWMDEHKLMARLAASCPTFQPKTS